MIEHLPSGSFRTPSPPCPTACSRGVAVDEEAVRAAFPQLAPGAADVGVDGAEAAAISPKLSFQILLREDAIGLGRQQRHYFELPRQQPHLPTMNLDPATGRIDQQRADPERNLTVGLRGVEDAAVEVPATERSPVLLLDHLRLRFRRRP